MTAISLQPRTTGHRAGCVLFEWMLLQYSLSLLLLPLGITNQEKNKTRMSKGHAWAVKKNTYKKPNTNLKANTLVVSQSDLLVKYDYL